MKQIRALGLFLAVLMGLMPLTASAAGLLYTNSISPVMATGAMPPKGGWTSLKVGESSSKTYLYMVEVGDAGINKACQEGGIQRIHAIDVRVQSYFVFFRRLTTYVYGE